MGLRKPYEQKMADIRAKEERSKQRALDLVARRLHRKQLARATKMIRLVAKPEFGIINLGNRWYSPLFLEFIRSNNAERYLMARRLDAERGSKFKE